MTPISSHLIPDQGRRGHGWDMAGTWQRRAHDIPPRDGPCGMIRVA
ncbi:hypothetical protein HGE74_04630 [Rhodobacteraceae bacterium R_SAG1]|nr:hypothetical protein [Rhodobacteraceae bacterium R_SAG1]